MAKPIVAIVGRPNVGKSTFFNHVTGKRISIVESTPGVTRDRIYSEVEWRGSKFTLIDTGGIEPDSTDEIKRQMKTQAEIAIETADVILFMVDARQGLAPGDKEIADILRESGKPIILVVNKVDRVGETPPDVYEFYGLGLGDFITISSEHGLGIGDLLDRILDRLPPGGDEDYGEDVIKVAVVGKPNVGKSLLVNRILGEERMIVSNVPGTTRDAVDSFLQVGEDKYIFIDTAGIRRKSRITENIERYSNIRSWTAIERADVCLVMIDACEGVTEQDSRIAGYAHEQGKASVIVVNKWDLVEKTTGTMEEYRKKVYDRLKFMTYAPVLFISAKTGQRVPRLFELIKYVMDQASMRISTGMLNDLVNEAVAMVQPPADRGKRLKIFYATQSSVRPPTYIVFINNMELMHYSYERYLENRLRESFGFEGTPIRFIYKEKKNME